MKANPVRIAPVKVSPMRRLARRNERGFSLLEVMASAFIFTVGALGLLTMFVSSTHSMTISERLTQATVLARGKLNELSRLPYDDVASGAESTNIDENGTAKGDYGYGADSDGYYARSWVVTQPDSTIPFKLIEVHVRWRDLSRKTGLVDHHITVSGGVSSQ